MLKRLSLGIQRQVGRWFNFNLPSQGGIDQHQVKMARVFRAFRKHNKYRAKRLWTGTPATATVTSGVRDIPATQYCPLEDEAEPPPSAFLDGAYRTSKPQHDR